MGHILGHSEEACGYVLFAINGIPCFLVAGCRTIVREWIRHRPAQPPTPSNGRPAPTPVRPPRPPRPAGPVLTTAPSLTHLHPPSSFISVHLHLGTLSSSTLISRQALHEPPTTAPLSATCPYAVYAAIVTSHVRP